MEAEQLYEQAQQQFKAERWSEADALCGRALATYAAHAGARQLQQQVSGHRRLVIESRWPRSASACPRLGHPPRLNGPHNSRVVGAQVRKAAAADVALAQGEAHSTAHRYLAAAAEFAKAVALFEDLHGAHARTHARPASRRPLLPA